MNINKVFFLGHVQGHPELSRERQTPLLTFMLAITEPWEARSGRRGIRTDVVRCRVYGVRAERLTKENAIVTGARLYLDGRYRREVEDGGGSPVEISYVEVNNLEMARELK